MLIVFLLSNPVSSFVRLLLLTKITSAFQQANTTITTAQSTLQISLLKHIWYATTIIKFYLCNINKLATYLLYIVLLTIISSCSQQQNNKKYNEENYKNLTKKISKIDKRNTNLIYNTAKSNDTLFIHPTKIIKNIGKKVNYTFSEIAPINTKVPINKSHFNPINTYDLKKNNNTITLINLVFDNDIFDNTDYYYTNGIFIELITPLAAHSPLSKSLLKLPNSQIILQGFSIRQNIYTPTNPDIAEISVDDRPFSAFLTIGQFTNSYNIKKKLSLKSSINFGVLGPASLGGYVQSSIHDIEPIGWTNQINNNFVIDYRVNLEKGIVSNPHIELNITAGANIGTIFNNINGGLYFRTGSFTPVFRGLSTIYGSTSKKDNLQYWFFIKGETNLVFYNATLQGSMFSSESPYIIQSQDINRLILNLSIGFAMYYKKVGFEFQNFYLSPEFTNAYDFRWGRVKLIFQF